MVLGEVIGECQHAFVEGRQILDAVMVASEVVDEVVRSRKDGVLCKLDMEKTYNHVHWTFVDYMLGQMRFGWKWRGWMKACITATSFVVMGNGGPSSFFRAFRGLRQGDPLSLLLFIIVMEVLNGLLEEIRKLGRTTFFNSQHPILLNFLHKVSVEGLNRFIPSFSSFHTILSLSSLSWTLDVSRRNAANSSIS